MNNEKEKLIKIYPELCDILNNIKKVDEILEKDLSPKIIGLISGTEENRIFLEKRFKETKIFKSSFIFSTIEEIRKQNFLGTLVFYKKLESLPIIFKDDVVLCGMVFGKGERLMPITNAFRNMKPAMFTPKIIQINNKMYQETLIESAMKYFTLVSFYLKEKGFRGILNKWGDEIQIPAVDLFKENVDYSDTDIIKVVSEQIVDETTAKEKDWVGYDKNNNLLRQIPRRPIEEFEKLYNQGIVKKNEKGQYICGVSLGPVAVSYRFLEIAKEVFADEIEKYGCYFDFDPYFIMAIALTQEKNSRELWEKERDKKINELDKMMVNNHYGKDFFDKILSLKKEFEKKYNKKLKMKTLNFGKVYWADLGLHNRMREYFMSLRELTRDGLIAREISGIPQEADENNNRIVNSELGDVEIKNSVIINSKINKGKIIDSVIINGKFHRAELNNSFSINDRSYSIKSEKYSGSIRTISMNHIDVPEKSRHVSIPLKEGIFHFIVSEEDDLRNEYFLSNPIRNNDRSFRKLYEDVFLISYEESEKIRLEFEKKIIEKIEQKNTDTE
ncbi:MAG: hypothetical protein QXW97_02455 [Candidatus Pacearchaeota archaeon]